MHKNLIPYLISYFLACFILLISFAFKCNVILYFLWLIPSIYGLLMFIKLYRIDKEVIKGNDDYNDHFLWKFNSKYDKKTTDILITLKFIIVIFFIIINVMSVKKISINNMSVLSFSLLIILIIMKCFAGSYKYNNGIEYNTWEITLTKPQLILLYKSNVFFFTISILPLIICCLYGNNFFKCIFSSIFFIFSIVLGYVYPIIYDLMLKKKV